MKTPPVSARLIADVAGVCRVMSLHLRSHPAKFIVGNYSKVHPSPAAQVPFDNMSILLPAKLTSSLPTAEDNMNVQLKDITVTARDGRVSHLDQVYIRGSHVRFFIVPDMLRNAPMFRSRGTRGRGVGLARGRATVNRARAGRTRG